MLRTDFITSPGEVNRQLEARPEIDSDDLWLAKFKNKHTKKGRKKDGKTGGSPSLVASDSLAGNSSVDSPLTRFSTSVTQMTGFSPLNPASSLHDELGNHSLGADSDFQPSTSLRPFARPAAAPTPLSRVPSGSTVAESGFTTPFEALRPMLFQRAFIESINGGRFDDTNIYVYSARSSAGNVLKPRALRARRAFINAACPRFEHEICPSLVVQRPVEPSCQCTRLEYGYDADSDLEDCEENTVLNAESSPPRRPMNSMQAPTPSSAVLNLSDGDVVSLDGFGSETGLSDILQETTTEGASSSRVPMRPSLGLDTNTDILTWRNDYEQKDATPRDAPNELPCESSPTVKLDVEHSAPLTGEATLFVPDSACRTWQALLLYLYNDHILFAPLRSEGEPSQLLTPEGPSCSPKSMYRLAAKLGLENLKQRAFEAIAQALSKDNIVKELFSDFTWRYPEILSMQTNVFYRYSSEAIVQAAMSETFQEIAYGQLPHSSIVLSSLFKRFVSAAQDGSS